MTDKLTRIRLRGKASGRYGLMDWGERSFEDMHAQITRYAEDMRDRAAELLAAKPEDFEVAVVRGSVVQHHVRNVERTEPPNA